MADHNIVELLNGINDSKRYNHERGPHRMSEEFFIDENGVPTDRFFVQNMPMSLVIIHKMTAFFNL
jgi:hypothetical protein